MAVVVHALCPIEGATTVRQTGLGTIRPVDMAGMGILL